MDRPTDARVTLEASGCSSKASHAPTFSGRLSAEILDDADEFGSLVSVVSGEVDEIADAGDDGALLGVGGDGDPAAAAELDEALVSEGAEGSQYGVGVHADDSGEVAGGGQALSGACFAFGDRASDLRGDLFVRSEEHTSELQSLR